MIYDLAIVGSGVAASAALIALREFKGSIVVVAPEREAGPRMGETLAATSAGVIDQLGIQDSFEIAYFPYVELAYSAWGSNMLNEHQSMKRREGPGWFLDREKFDDWLWSEAKTTKHTRVVDSLRQFERDGDVWQLESRDGKHVTARFILDASGRSMVVGRRLSERMVVDQLTALYMFLDQAEDYLATEATLVEAVADGWWYSSVMEQGKMCLAYFCDADLFDKALMKNPRVWRAHLAESEFTSERVKSAGFSCYGKMPKSTGANGARLKQFGGEGWLATGDAAMAFDPLSSHGITTALWSGRKAALAAMAVLDGDSALHTDYVETVEKGWQNYVQQHHMTYGREQRFQDSPFWQRRHSPVLTSNLNS